jgi:Ser/Thr protein kinase RdoA (MazF antagonist)
MRSGRSAYYATTGENMELSRQETQALGEFSRLFNLDAEKNIFLSRSVGLVFESLRSGAPVILKMAVTDASGSPALDDQLDWIRYLSANGVSVTRFIASANNALRETVELDGILFSAFVYHKIDILEENKIVWDAPAMHDTPRLAGKTMGKMHRLYKERKDRPAYATLGQWDSAPWLKAPGDSFHVSQHALVPSVSAACRELSRFPITDDNYGMIHDDFHTGNIFRMGDDITVLDFGCLQYNWFAQDICSALIFRVWISADKNRLKGKAVEFLSDFIEGYKTENAFDPDWLKMFPALLKAREISLYFSFFGRNDISGSGADEFRDFVYDSILHNKPFLDIDFSSIRI